MKKIQIDKDLLYKLYYEDNKSLASIAKELHLGLNTVKRNFKEYGFKAIVSRKKDMKDRKVTEIACEYCGKMFFIKNCLIDKADRHCCSCECSSKLTMLLTRDKRLSGDTVPCENCGMLHYKAKNLINNGLRNFCSHKCHSIYRSRNLVGEKSKTYTKVTTECSNCRKVIKRTKSAYEKNKHNFCSVSCMGDFYKGKLCGDKNPNWRGGYNNHGYGPFWKRISEQIRIRDNYTCQRCKTHQKDFCFGVKLDVHHKIPLRIFNGDYDKANSDENLVSLCSYCHIIEENAYREFEKQEIN